MRNAAWLLDQLEDPFTMFPLESVADTLFEGVHAAELRKVECMRNWGVARKFWSVEEEQYHEQIGLLLGSIFVLGQAAITQTVSILNELRRHLQAEKAIPKGKVGKLEAHAATEAGTKLSVIVIVNAVSNYFKHVYEWPEPWNAAPMKGSQGETIRIVQQFGMQSGREIADNLMFAATRLDLDRNNPRAIARCIQEWREGWARGLYPSFGLPNPRDGEAEHKGRAAAHELG